MKKYIRTKDGIYKNNYGVDTIKELQETKWFFDKTILKQADTIEDLCDRFVVEYTFGDHTTFQHFCDLERHYELYSQDYHHVAGRYGAIWVAGKGLIYVAKMNKQGELELI